MLRQVTFAIFVAAATGRYKEALASWEATSAPFSDPSPRTREPRQGQTQAQAVSSLTLVSSSARLESN